MKQTKRFIKAFAMLIASSVRLLFLTSNNIRRADDSRFGLLYPDTKTVSNNILSLPVAEYTEELLPICQSRITNPHSVRRFDGPQPFSIYFNGGPACEQEDILREMCLAGMNVARLNFSHGTHEEHQKKIDTLKKVRDDLNLPIAIMLDTKGPEYRIGTFENHKIYLNDGDPFAFTSDDCVGTNERVSVSTEKAIDYKKTICFNGV